MAKIIQQSRILWVGTLASSVAITTLTSGTVITKNDNLIQNPLANEVYAFRIVSSQATESAGVGTIQSAAASLYTASIGLVQPAFSGNPLGLANLASFEAEIRAHSEDFQTANPPPYGNANNIGGNLGIVVYNPSASTIHVSALNVVFEVIRVQYDEPVYE